MIFSKPPSWVLDEMKQAVEFMWSIAFAEPVIAGGALWSWAAHKQARDVDIFIRKPSDELRAKLESMFSRRDGRSPDEATYPARRLTAELPNGTPVDIVIMDDDKKLLFDWQHCNVSFSHDGIQRLDGVSCYMDAKLVSQGTEHPRSSDDVLKKVHAELWGKVDAAPAMINALHRLEQFLQPGVASGALANG